MAESEKLIFANVVQALFIEGLADVMSGPCRSRMRQAGIDLERKLLPGYPYLVWERCLEVAAEELFTALPREEAMRQLGHRMIEGLLKSSYTAKMLPLLRVMGTRKAVKRALTHPGNAENFNRVSYEELGPNRVKLGMSHVGKVPNFTQGTCEAIIARLGGKGAAARVVEYAEPAAVYELTWEE